LRNYTSDIAFIDPPYKQINEYGTALVALSDIGCPLVIAQHASRVALADRYGNALIRSECHRHIGFYYASEDIQPEQALRHLRTSLELRQQWGDPRWRPSATFAVGMAELAGGMRADGIDHLRQALQESRDARLSERRIKSGESWLHRAEAGETPG